MELDCLFLAASWCARGVSFRTPLVGGAVNKGVVFSHECEARDTDETPCSGNGAELDIAFGL